MEKLQVVFISVTADALLELLRRQSHCKSDIPEGSQALIIDNDAAARRAELYFTRPESDREPAVKERYVAKCVAEFSTDDIRPIGQTSDGFHTFDELYAHRYALWIAVCRLVANDPQYPYRDVWRCRLNSDGTSYPGYFLLAITLGGYEKDKQLSYHLPLSMWDQCEFAFTHEESQPFDGHTSADVLDRLKGL